MGEPEEAILECFVLELERVELSLVESQLVLEVDDTIARCVVDGSSRAFFLNYEFAVWAIALLLHPSYYSDK